MKESHELKSGSKKNKFIQLRLREDVYENIFKWSDERGISMTALITPWIMQAYNEQLKKSEAERESKP